LIPKHGDGDVIVAAGNIQRKEVVDVSRDFITDVANAVIWCMRYIFIPFGVAISARIVAEKYCNHSLKDKEKNGLSNRLK
jgi:hypothetical protein